MPEKILTAAGGFFGDVYRTAGLRGCLRKVWAALNMQLPLWVLGRRSNRSVGAYFDLITDDGRLFYGDSFHFGYFPNGETTLKEGLEAHTDIVAEMACLQKDALVLDIGCGIGEPAARIARRYPVRITGINISGEQIRQGNELIAERGVADRVTLLQGNALEPDFKDGAFDALLCIEVAGDICVTEDQKRTLVREMFRVLKPGGTIGFSDLVFKGCPDREDERTMRMILYHEGRELITDWPSLFQKEGFVVSRQIDILRQTMETWAHTLRIYEREKNTVVRRYGRRIAALTMEHLKRLPQILMKYGSFPVLSIQKPAVCRSA